MGLKYFKKDGKVKWHLTDENHIPTDMVFETVLSLESNPDDLESKLDQKYWGPFYIDIDSEDLQEALDEARIVAKYLVNGYQLNPSTDLKFFATGKKGFHILLNPFTFMDVKPKAMLPYRYKMMAAGIARSTGVTLDMVVYSGGKGRMWRLPNVERDNGKFKVELSYTSLIAEDIDFIHNNLCTEPRDLSAPFKKVDRNPLVTSWFKASEVKEFKSTKPVSDSDLNDMDIPDCISRLKDLDGIGKDVRFNSLILNAATYGARMRWTEAQALKYFIPTLDYHSSVYKTRDDKVDHFSNVFGFVSTNPEYKFDCGFICKVVDNPACNTCPIKVGQDAEGADEEFGIFIKNNSYYIQDGDSARRLSGFTMKILHDIVMDNGDTFYDLEIVNARGKRKTVTIPENVFHAKAAFTKYLSPDFPLWCSERELAMVGWYLRKDDPNEQIGRDFIGLHWEAKEWHYANEQGSISLAGTIDKVKVNAKSLTIVNTKLDFDWPKIEKEALEKTVDSLLEFNVAQVVIPSVGWFLASFMKPHYDKAFSQFPLLFFFGEAGSGKTSTGLVLRRLYAMADTALKSIADVTQFSLMAACNSSNLVPLILDEYKPMMMKETQAQLVSRLIRGAYNSSRGERGTASQEIIAYYYRAPIMLLGEQSIIETAVQHRVIEVQLTRMYMKEKPEGAKHIEFLRDAPLESIGKEFLTFVMGIKPAEIKKKVLAVIEGYDGSLPLPERPLYNHAVLKVTYEYFDEFLLSNGVNRTKEINAKFAEYETFITVGNHVIDSIINKNDVIKIIDLFNLLANIQSSPYPILQNVHFGTSDDDKELYIDVETMFPLFSKYNKEYHLGMFDMGMTSFMKMLQKESFCKIISRSKLIGKNAKLIAVLNVERCKEYEVNLSNFIVDYNSAD